jgi:hypothetical protein
MQSLNLSKVQFTNQSDVVNPGTELFNPKFSAVATLRGNDQIIGTANLTGDFAFSAFVEIAALDSNAIASANLSGKATVAVDGIKNQGIIHTNQGSGQSPLTTLQAGLLPEMETILSRPRLPDRTLTASLAAVLIWDRETIGRSPPVLPVA